MTLRELRKLGHQTQAQLAEKMGITQQRVLDIENSPIDSLHVRTLRAYVEALGGELVLQITTTMGPIAITGTSEGHRNGS